MSEKVAKSPSSTKAKMAVKKDANSKASKSLHPSTVDMVFAAVAALRERTGSSLQAIKKYIAATYLLDADRLAPYIKKYIKAAVVSGDLLQIKGKGASGSFKLSNEKKILIAKKKAAQAAVARKVASAATKPAIAKKASVGKTSEDKVEMVKKSVAAKKPTVKKPVSEKTTKKVSSVKSAVVKAAKSPSKAKKTLKAPTGKPKAPKPKKISPPKSGLKKAVPVEK